ncbi:MAG: zinc-ribbon domain-containing protein [Candidatus Lokiarchaeia archaeon]|nr:zinc-ribbon domain-containing protein [Candidatus Lokiarchaeia archaeon]
MYCQNCGSEIDQNASICPFCGQANKNTDIMRSKDIKIQELEQKIAKLEEDVKTKSNSPFKKNIFNAFPWFFVVPIVFVIVFFLLFILLITMT